MLNEDQKTEWFESPVTEHFFALLKRAEDKANTDLQEQGYDANSLATRGNLWGIRDALADIGWIYEAQSFHSMFLDATAVQPIKTGY